MHRIACLTLFLLAAPAVAQTTSVILPNSAATKSPAYWNSYLFYGTTSTSIKNESHLQALYADSEIGGVKTFKEIQVRRPQNLGNQNQAVTGNLILDLSSTATAHTAASTTFATNHGANKATVFNSTVNLPARNRGGSWPDPWETAIGFTSTFLYLPMSGGSLVVESQFSNNSAKQVWYVEGGRAESGVRTTNLSACSAHSDGGRNNSISYTFPVVGGSWFVQYGGMPSNVPSMTSSFQVLGVGGAGQTQWGLTLPIPLSILSQPSNGCSLAVTWDFFQPLTYTPSTSGPNRGSLRSPTIPIPNNPILAGVSFYDQAVCTDTNRTTNQPEFYMSWSSKWTVGSGMGEPMSMVYRIGDNTQTTGTYRKWEAPTLRLNQ